MLEYFDGCIRLCTFALNNILWNENVFLLCLGASLLHFKNVQVPCDLFQIPFPCLLHSSLNSFLLYQPDDSSRVSGEQPRVSEETSAEHAGCESCRRELEACRKELAESRTECEVLADHQRMLVEDAALVVEKCNEYDEFLENAEERLRDLEEGTNWFRQRLGTVDAPGSAIVEAIERTREECETENSRTLARETYKSREAGFNECLLEMKKRFQDLDLTSVVYGRRPSDDEDELSSKDLDDKLILTPEEEAVITLMDIHRFTPVRRALFKSRTTADPLDKASRSSLIRERALPCHFLPL